jgi:hypothetical protein
MNTPTQKRHISLIDKSTSTPDNYSSYNKTQLVQKLKTLNATNLHGKKDELITRILQLEKIELVIENIKIYIG